MIENQYYKTIPTELDLNGPILSFTTQPVGVGSTVTGSVTLTGIATATFPNSADNTGILSYRWYKGGVALTDGTNITGSGTTQLTVSNLQSPNDNGSEYFLRVDYNSSSDTGNAINEPLDSIVGIVTVAPLIEIIAEPTTRQVGVNADSTFSVNASLTDETYGDVSYQWQIDGVNVSDGSISKVITTSTLVATDVDRTFTSDGNLNLIDATNVVLVVAGAQGGGGGDDSGGSGAGGFNGRAGRLPYIDGTRTLSFKIGKAGNGGGVGNQNAGGSGGASSYARGGNGGGAGAGGWSGGGGGGGGATAVYDSVKGGYTIISAGGGGGGGGSHNRPSPGAAPNARGVGLGFGRVRTAMESGSSSPDPGNDGQTHNGDGAGGGGGGGGGQPSNFPDSGGGGSSGADNSNGGTPGNGGASGYDPNYASFNFDGYGNSGDGYVNIKYTGLSEEDTSVTRVTNISGSRTPTLTVSADQVGIQTVQCIITSDKATNVSVGSSVANFVTVSEALKYDINVEAIGVTDAAALTTVDLGNGDVTVETTSSDAANNAFATEYVFYSDKNINVEMDLYGGKGKGFDDIGGTGEDYPSTDGYLGGEGGYSRIRFTMDANVEYVIAGLTEAINTPFLYRKGSLMACVGAGGDGGHYGRGGAGGGIDIAGEDGQGRNSGLGGVSVGQGNLSENGIFGGIFDPAEDDILSGDTSVSGTNSGRAIKCTKGVYWAQQGISACSDVGQVKYRLSDGSEVTNTTSSIERGYKAGYNIIQTAGSRGGSDGGNGGNGATGGSAGTSSGGGGGSGFSDGSVTIVDNQLGGSAFTNAKIVLRVVTS